MKSDSPEIMSTPSQLCNQHIEAAALSILMNFPRRLMTSRTASSPSTSRLTRTARSMPSCAARWQRGMAATS